MTRPDDHEATDNTLGLAPASWKDGLDDLVQEVVYERLVPHLPERARIVDLGGAPLQALGLARTGHRVLWFGSEPTLIDEARRVFAGQPQAVRDRLTVVGGARPVSTAIGRESFDAAGCHELLRYLDDFTPTIETLLAVLRPGGLLSIVVENDTPGGWRVRQQAWSASVPVVVEGSVHVQHKRDRLARIEQTLDELGVQVLVAYGIGYVDAAGPGFTLAAEAGDRLRTEVLGGVRDPYRRTARLLQVIARVPFDGQIVGAPDE